MLIYKVVENFWQSDSDGWRHYLQERIISYHKSPEGATKKLASFPDSDATIPYSMDHDEQDLMDEQEMGDINKYAIIQITVEE
jgi:hypothetical protein